MPPDAIPDAALLAQLTTEQRDPALADLDTLPTLERCRLQNAMDRAVADAVAGELEAVARAVDLVAARLRAGGRLIYAGAGTSGRLGVLDAAECPPTFGTPPAMVRAVIAGGEAALTRAVEGVEDDPEAGAAALRALDAAAGDCVVGIAASGRTPYVLGALAAAREVGAATVGVANNKPSAMAAYADVMIAVVVGPELVAGSTRLKSGTAQKLVLNMLTTQSMIALGKTYGDAMVDVVATNAKLRARALRLVRGITGAGDAEASAALERSGGHVKPAALALLRGIAPERARELLAAAGGSLRAALAAE